ncbi:DUF2520 domain-containing protein [Bizionia argentinensis JUB59]|uniref:DUF2520 domain-containing protein n=1 Tax=Bizionia argentinensis JUB59 TaxID=1046627 RepID=G2ECI2_9FLAO|nr:DUF2520 domain-containing protein [Bizionia argentinensis]EGV43866.1 DUF2520 domain-containing protein [Bizionia argentinensis JUB59]
MITVIIIGAGNVATHLYKAFRQAETISIVQWYNRDIRKLAMHQSDVETIDDLSLLKPADVYIIAVSDDAIAKISEKLPFEDRFVVHTSGSVSVYDIDQKNRRGVFYPLQTFSKDVPLPMETVPICLETIGKKDAPLLKKLGESIGCKTYKVNSDQRRTLHLAAVFVNNFTNQLYRVAHEITEAEGVEFDILKPLILETANKVQNISPYLAQTGPAKRNDKKTIKKHLKLLESEQHQAIYKLLTSAIKQTQGVTNKPFKHTNLNT